MAFDDIVNVTEAQLRERPAPAPDLARENAAMLTLADELAQRPDAVLESLCEIVIDVCNAGSAGVSLLQEDAERFFWPAISGAWSGFVGGTMPRWDSPCGHVLKHDCVLVFQDITETFPAVAGATPPITEVMLAPFHVGGKAVGTVWALSHDDRRFDSECKRILINISRFAAAAYMLARSRDTAKDAEDRLSIVNRELNHRIKNLLSMVMAMASQSLKGHVEEETAALLQRRLAALSTAQDVLVRNDGVTASIRDIAEGVLQRAGQLPRISLASDAIMLGPKATLSLSLILHELATNAVKYGALSTERGKVLLGWRVDGETVSIEWREQGGPPVTAPARKGFGSQLIDLGLLGEGGATIEFAPDGLQAKFAAPLAEAQQS